MLKKLRQPPRNGAPVASISWAMFSKFELFLYSGPRLPDYPTNCRQLNRNAAKLADDNGREGGPVVAANARSAMMIANRGIAYRFCTLSCKNAIKLTSSLRHVCLRLRKASLIFLPNSLRVPPEILSLIFALRAHVSELLLCKGVLGLRKTSSSSSFFSRVFSSWRFSVGLDVFCWKIRSNSAS